MNKKQKLDSNHELTLSNIEVIPVLSDGILGPIKLLNVIVLKIKDKKMASKSVKETSLHFPVPDLQHLKRIKRTEFNSSDSLFIYIDYLTKFNISFDFEENEIFSNVSNEQEDYILNQIRKRGFDLSLYEKEVFVSKVPLYPPKTRKMYEESVKYWPCSFHEDLYLSKMISGNFFDSDELVKIIKNMNEVLLYSNSIEDENDSGVILIMNNKTNIAKVMTKSSRSKHPLQHATMVAIDLVAHQHGGGAWVHDEQNLSKFTKTAVPPSDNKDDIEYICTNCDVYLSHEPCMMCAMALLHSRVRRVFYFYPNSVKGAINSVCKLHTLPGINHRYEVFNIKMK